MAYKQPYNSPNLKIGKERTMKVRIKPGKEGELSNYAMDHVTKTNKRGKVTVEVPKSEMNLSKSKLFNTSKPKWTSNPNADPPSSSSTAKGFKKQRNKDRVLKALAGTVLGGFTLKSSLQKKGSIALVEDKSSRRNKRENKKAKQYTEEVTGVKEEKPFTGYSRRDLKNPNAPKVRNNKSGCGKDGLLNIHFGGCFDGGKSSYR